MRCLSQAWWDGDPQMRDDPMGWLGSSPAYSAQHAKRRMEGAKELNEAKLWQQRLRGLFDKYLAEMSTACFFCGAPLDARIANDFCSCNSDREIGPPTYAMGLRLPDGHWGSGLHFWIKPEAATLDCEQLAVLVATRRARWGLPPLNAWHVLRTGPRYASVGERNAILERQEQLEFMLDEYAKEFANVCCYCRAPFNSHTVNTSCVNHIDERFQYDSFASDPLMPRHRQLRGMHFWVPQLFNEPSRLAPWDSRSNIARDQWSVRKPIPMLQQPMQMSPRRSWQRMQFASDPPQMQRHARAVSPPRLVHLGHLDRLPQNLQIVLQNVVGAVEREHMNVRKAFQIFDARNTGLLSKDEFVQALEYLQLGLASSETQLILSSLRTTMDGMVNYEEFLELLKQCVHY